MRLLATFDNERNARTFSAFLTKEKIENQLEVVSNTDWGSADYGTVIGRLWIVEEDKVATAQTFYEEFLEDPQDPRYTGNVMQIPSILEPIEEKIKSPTIRLGKTKPIGFLTLYIIISCTIILFFGILTQRPYESPPPNIPLIPLYTPDINKTLSYDYPYAYEIIDKLVNAYGIEKLQNPQELPPEAKFLLQEYKNTPIWTGLYDKIVSHFTEANPAPYFNAPMFEKIRQGEIWRLFTPVLLHDGPLHLLFNMIWFLILGKQMEERLGILRFGVFLLLAGIFSNTAQYLMTGPNFIGFSGIICAMITFIWFRQKKAVWEGYQLLPMTMGFVTIFIVGLLGLQILSFALEIQGIPPFIPAIVANTAHISGAIIGYIFACTNLFARR